jgi:prolyl 4-hydroxylase
MLDEEWKKWININLNNRCSLVQMFNDMTRNGIPQDHALIGLNQQLSKVRYRPHPYMTEKANFVTIKEDDKELKIPIVFKCGNPEIVVFSNFLSDEECDGLIEIATARLTDSQVISHEDGTSVFHEHRTSKNAFFRRGESQLIEKIEARISKLLNIPVINGEGLQVLNYGVGKEYKPHYDFFDSNTGSGVHIRNGGQRVGTFLMYLNEVEEGGSTSFPELEMNVYPQKGNALFFSYTNNQYQCDDRSLHAGDPVIVGSKWLATKWLREHEFKQPEVTPAPMSNPYVGTAKVGESNTAMNDINNNAINNEQNNVINQQNNVQSRQVIQKNVMPLINNTILGGVNPILKNDKNINFKFNDKKK